MSRMNPFYDTVGMAHVHAPFNVYLIVASGMGSGLP